MKIISAEFVKGAVGADEAMEDGIPQVAFIGRSNAGKSSIINSLADRKNLARTSSLPGRTKEMNIFLINNSLRIIDLPGYGFAKASLEDRERLQKMIHWYLFESQYEQAKIVLIIDANIGPTDIDMEMLRGLEAKKKEIIIVANKIDKIKKSEYKRRFQEIQSKVGSHLVISYSAKKKIGAGELIKEILKK